MSTRCYLDQDCTFDAHEPSDHPCGVRHIPGSACRYCGNATPLDGSACPDCWTPIPNNLADAKALLALGGLSVGIPTNDDLEDDA